MDELEVIVIDNGSGSIKAGYSGEDAPRSIFPSIVGTVEDREAYRGQGESRLARVTRAAACVVTRECEYATADIKDCYVGSEAQDHRELLSINWAIKRGMIEDWDAMEQLWEYTFSNELHVSPDTAGMPVLLTDAPLNPKQNREHMAQIMFEKFKVPGFYIATQVRLQWGQSVVGPVRGGRLLVSR